MDLEIVPVANDMGTVTVLGELPYVRQLYMAQHVLYHINCSCNSLTSVYYCRWVNDAGLSDATINDAKHACILTAAAQLPHTSPRIKRVSAYPQNV